MQSIRDIHNDSLFFDISINSLKEGKRISFSAKGASMYPTIKDGDILYIEPLSAGNIQKRDIILYTENDGVIVHRLVSIRHKSEETSFFTRGDNSSGRKEISAKQVLGRLSSFERQGKRFSLNNSLIYYFYIKLRYFFARIFRKLPFGITHKFVAVKKSILT